VRVAASGNNVGLSILSSFVTEHCQNWVIT
jgi:hypothetical protein